MTPVGIFSTISAILNSKLLVKISPQRDNALFYPKLPNFTNQYFLFRSHSAKAIPRHGAEMKTTRSVSEDGAFVWKACHTRVRLFKEVFRNSAGIVGLERATHVKATRNVTKKGTLQKIPAVVQWGLHERKPVALKAHSHAVALTLLGV